MIDDGRALFLQIAENIENSIVDGSLAEDSRAPSTNELAAFYRVNPATAAKGLTVLADKGVLTKRRGIGMFVTDGAREQLRSERRTAFARRYIEPLMAEAATIGMSAADVAALIREHGDTAGGAAHPDVPAGAGTREEPA